MLNDTLCIYQYNNISDLTIEMCYKEHSVFLNIITYIRFTNSNVLNDTLYLPIYNISDLTVDMCYKEHSVFVNIIIYQIYQ